MSISIIQRLFAFFDNVWSFILTLVRSLLALFSFRRRSSDPFSLPRVNRPPKDALARAHNRLRPILLTPRSIAFSPAHRPQRAQSTRTRSATSTLVPGQNENATASGSGSHPSGPQRTSPKLDPPDVELGLSVISSIAGPPGAVSLSEGTSDISSGTTPTDASSALPLTPPDRCYLAPMPSATDCWPTNVPNKRRLPGSPLKVSTNAGPSSSEPMVRPIGSPPPGHWDPAPVWTSTPCKIDISVPDPAPSLSDHQTQSTMDPLSGLANISHALISRSRSSIHPYDEASNSSPSSNVSLFVNGTNRRVPVALQPGPAREHHRKHVQVTRPKIQAYRQFHYPDAYVCAWRRHGVRVPGKRDCASRTHCYARSLSHMDLLASEWYGADAYAPSPITALSPPLGDSATDSDDDDEIPLNCLKDRLTRRHGLGVRKAMSPSTRRMSEGCLLAISQSTPTRIGLGSRSGRSVISLALEGEEGGSQDWLEALSLRFSSEQKEALVPTLKSVDGVAG